MITLIESSRLCSNGGAMTDEERELAALYQDEPTPEYDTSEPEQAAGAAAHEELRKRESLTRVEWAMQLDTVSSSSDEDSDGEITTKSRASGCGVKHVASAASAGASSEDTISVKDLRFHV